MRIVDATDTRGLNRLLGAAAKRDAAFERRVAAIVSRVRTEGDRALHSFARRFDGVDPPLEIPVEAIRSGARMVPAEVRRAIRTAAANIRRVAGAQRPASRRLAVAPGISVDQRVVPLARVGCYVPGGRFPLPSSLLMTAIPASTAGVREIIAVCPRPEPAVLAAALEAGVTRLFKVGGAHAIAALAYGTATIPRVDKIVGPGNRYVAAAKALVARDCAIDFYAGPSEIVIVAGSGRADWIAADLVAQAEHDPDARAVLITWSRTLAERVARAVALRSEPGSIAATALDRNGGIIRVGTRDEAIALANRYAPEHLVAESDAVANAIDVAGAVFVGPYTAQAAGDYATGSNHVLPTAGAARFRGGLSAADFVRVMSVQRLTRRGLASIAPAATMLARAEGLEAHARSIEIRLGASSRS
jgi:histidinol dehydrogenase